MDKAGIGITVGILAVVMVIGVSSTSGVSIFDGLIEMEEKPSTPVIQEKPSTPVIQKASSIPMVNAKSGNASYISSTGDVIDHLDFKISEGDVKSMYLDKYSSSLVINFKSTEDGELFVALDEGYIGSDDGTFFVIVGDEESNDYEQAGSDLFISFPAGTEKIEIVGNYVIL
tara:strand:- start:48 stop:563 length:516 start_codon:yes stop_codon:yes gene_type:complete